MAFTEDPHSSTYYFIVQGDANKFKYVLTKTHITTDCDLRCTLCAQMCKLSDILCPAVS
jgi:hypothetical protein